MLQVRYNTGSYIGCIERWSAAGKVLEAPLDTVGFKHDRFKHVPWLYDAVQPLRCSVAGALFKVLRDFASMEQVIAAPCLHIVPCLKCFSRRGRAISLQESCSQLYWTLPPPVVQVLNFRASGPP